MDGLFLRHKWTDFREKKTMCGDSWSHHVMPPWQTSGDLGVLVGWLSLLGHA